MGGTKFTKDTQPWAQDRAAEIGSLSKLDAVARIKAQAKLLIDAAIPAQTIEQWVSEDKVAQAIDAVACRLGDELKVRDARLTLKTFVFMDRLAARLRQEFELAVPAMRRDYLNRFNNLNKGALGGRQLVAAENADAYALLPADLEADCRRGMDATRKVWQLCVSEPLKLLFVDEVFDQDKGYLKASDTVHRWKPVKGVKEVVVDWLNSYCNASVYTGLPDKQLPQFVRQQVATYTEGTQTKAAYCIFWAQVLDRVRAKCRVDGGRKELHARLQTSIADLCDALRPMLSVEQVKVFVEQRFDEVFDYKPGGTSGEDGKQEQEADTFDVPCNGLVSRFFLGGDQKLIVAAMRGQLPVDTLLKDRQTKLDTHRISGHKKKSGTETIAAYTVTRIK